MAHLRNIPEDVALPGDRIDDIVIHETQTNPDALAIDKHIAKLGKPYDALLVLQGGALRAIYSAGVLDAFLDAGIAFADVVGISAGTLMGMDYICGARGLAAYMNFVYTSDPRYVGLRDLVLKRQIFNFDFMFNDIASYLMPFDYERFFNSPMRLTAVASDCATAQARYFWINEPGITIDRVAACASASSSLPLFSRPAMIDGHQFLDGGVTDPLGMGKALEAVAQGRKVVFVCTRERGFKKPPLNLRWRRVYKTFFAKYPKFTERLFAMNDLNNSQLDDVDDLAARGLAFAIHPVKAPEVSHTERDTKKLRELYDQGLYEGVCAMPALLAYLEG